MSNATTKDNMEYGLGYAAPKDGRPVWGARAIQTRDGGLDLVWDRTSIHHGDSTKGERDALVASLQATCEVWAQDARDMRNREGKLRGAGTVELSTGDRHLTVLADTNGSYGYVYLCAYRTDREMPEAKWTGDSPPPAIGDTVQPYPSGFGPGPVLGYHDDHGYLVVHYLPSSAPDWYVTENGGLRPACLFGTDLAAPTTTEACRDCA
jgi:hypothetical protein